jgi:hypothetical protein
VPQSAQFYTNNYLKAAPRNLTLTLLAFNGKPMLTLHQCGKSQEFGSVLMTVGLVFTPIKR